MKSVTMSLGHPLLLLVVLALAEVTLPLNLADVPCGRRSSRVSPLLKIVGGATSQRGQLPWICLLRYNQQAWCSATIINRHYAITASHCIKSRPASRFELVLGEHDLTVSEQGERSIGVQAIALHPAYVPSSYRHDIAVLRLAEPLVWSSLVQPVCLPDADEEAFDGRQATVAGWGWLAEFSQGGKRADVLQQVQVPVIGHQQCTEWFHEAGKRNTIQEGQICAGYQQGGRDSCQGDSGGPLMVGEEGVSVLAGVVSAGIGCARPGLPGVYTDVRKYVDWIQSKAV